MPGPSIINIKVGELNVYDTFFLVAFISVLIHICIVGKVSYSLDDKSLLGLLYPYTVVLFSLLGCAVYSYPAGYLFGDLRWIQALVLVLILFYSCRRRKNVVQSVGYIVVIGVLINAVFVLMQMYAATSFEPPFLLEWWYKDVPQSSSRPLGFQLNRFGGATGQPSTLGFFAAVSVGYGLTVVKKTSVRIVTLCSSFLLLIASGSRTALVASIVSFLPFVFMSINESILRVTAYFILVISLVIPVAISTDLGRVSSSNRYQELISIATGDASYSEVSGRGKIWKEVVENRNDNFLLLGTLSNPSHVYNSTPIDSGYVHIYSRLGPLGLFIFFLSIVPQASGLWKDSKSSIFSVSILVVLLVMMINANTLTTISGKVMVLLSIFLVSNEGEK